MVNALAFVQARTPLCVIYSCRHALEDRICIGSSDIDRFRFMCISK